MSTGAIAMAAVILGGAQWVIIAVIVAVLIYTKRILFAATPKPRPQQPGAQPVDLAARRTGT